MKNILKTSLALVLSVCVFSADCGLPTVGGSSENGPMYVGKNLAQNISLDVKASIGAKIQCDLIGTKGELTLIENGTIVKDTVGKNVLEKDFTTNSPVTLTVISSQTDNSQFSIENGSSKLHYEVFLYTMDSSGSAIQKFDHVNPNNNTCDITDNLSDVTKLKIKANIVEDQTAVDSSEPGEYTANLKIEIKAK